MIIRVWSGRAEPSRRDAYPEHFRTVVMPDLTSVDGFVGAHLATRERDGLVEFVVLTRWVSMAAIHAFAGDDADRAVVEPGAVAALADFDDTVAHYEVVEHLEASVTP